LVILILPSLPLPCQDPYANSPFLHGDCHLETDFSPVSSAAALIQDRDGNVLLKKVARSHIKGSSEFRAVSWKYLGGWPNEYSQKSIVYAVNNVCFRARIKSFQNIQTYSDQI
jgi:hypothetical protein